MNSVRRVLLSVLPLFFIGVISFMVLKPDDKLSPPTMLKIGILPDESDIELRKRFAPFIKYLSLQTGIDTQLVVPASYAELVQLFSERQVDLAYFGGLTFVQAQTFYDASPLVMRTVDTRFTSWFLIKGDRSGDTIEDYKDKSFSFGSRLSTSGHLMPRHFLQTELNIAPEHYFSTVSHSNTHDETAYQVRDGVVDIGVANARIIKSMISSGRLNHGDLHVLWETPPYTDYVWAVHDDLNETLKTQLRDAFLALNIDQTEHREILQKMGAQSFLPAGKKDFVILEEIATRLALLDHPTQ